MKAFISGIGGSFATSVTEVDYRGGSLELKDRRIFVESFTLKLGIDFLIDLRSISFLSLERRFVLWLWRFRVVL